MSNPTALSEIATLLDREFAPLLGKYSLRLVVISNDEALLIGNGYALGVGGSIEGADFFFYTTSKDGKWTEYALSPISVERFKPEHRSRYGNPRTKVERWEAAIRVYASGLEATAQDVLSGDQSWLNQKTWYSARPSPAVESVLRNAMRS